MCRLFKIIVVHAWHLDLQVFCDAQTYATMKDLHDEKGVVALLKPDNISIKIEITINTVIIHKRRILDIILANGNIVWLEIEDLSVNVCV